jgi:hypothetical protein
VSIYFAGDRVRAAVDGQPVTGVIADFTYDVPALHRGEPGDVARVRTGDGRTIAVPCTDLETA